MNGKKPVHFTDECTEKNTPTYIGLPLAVDLFSVDSLMPLALKTQPARWSMWTEGNQEWIQRICPPGPKCPIEV